MLTLTTFFSVFLLAFQSQNIIAGHYGVAAITSIGIAAAQTHMMRGMTRGHGGMAFVRVATGGVLGVEAAMLLFRFGM